MSEQMKAQARRVIEEIWNNQDLAAVDEIYSQDFEFRAHGFPAQFRGPENLKQFVRMNHAAFPDMRITIDELVSEGESVVMRWTFQGTNTGELDFGGTRFPATNAQVVYQGVTIGRNKGEKAVLELVWPDTLTMLQQLGLMADPAAAQKIKDLHRVVEETINTGEVSGVDEVFAPGYVHHGPQGSLHRGPEGFRQLVSELRTAIPDIHFAVEQMVVQGDWISVSWSFRGTHSAEWLGVKATGKPVMLFGTSTSKVAGGKFIETWAHWDVLEALHQIGAAAELLPVEVKASGEGRGKVL